MTVFFTHFIDLVGSFLRPLGAGGIIVPCLCLAGCVAFVRLIMYIIVPEV